jgi:hypothetical protein
MTRFKRIFSLVLAAFALAGTAAPSYAAIIYNVTNYAAGQNGWSVNGTITASGTGTFTNASAITAWDITLSKDLVSYQFSNLTSTAGSPRILRGTLNATSTTLSLPTGSEFLLEEITNTSRLQWSNQFPSEMMGVSSIYYAGWNGVGTLWTSSGSNVFSPIVDGAFTLGAAAAVPEPSTYAMALAGLACGGYTMFRRRKRA